MQNQEWLIVDDAVVKNMARDLQMYLLNCFNLNFGAPEVSSLAQLSDWLIAAERQKPGTARSMRESIKRDARVQALLTAPAFAALIQAQFGCARVALHDVVRLRTVMRDQEFTHSRPHQDAALWPQNLNDLNCWLALCDIDNDLAPLCVVPGSTVSIYPHRNNQFEQMEIDAQIGPECTLPTSFGEMLLFSPRLVHFAAPNRTGKVRWSIDFRLHLQDDKTDETHRP